MSGIVSTQELKPCPCCGSPAHFFKIDDLDSREHGGEGICCQTEGCLTTGLMWSLMDGCKPILAERWNRRASQPAAAQLAGDIAWLIEWMPPFIFRSDNRTRLGEIEKRLALFTEGDGND